MDWKEDDHPRDNKGQFAEKNSNDNNTDSSIIKSSKLYSNDKVVMLPKQEYAELCSAIRTKYANKIPKSGSMLYNNSYYVYNYDKKSELIVCTFKVAINNNEDLICELEENGYGR